jgi:hypothetical protein
VCARCAVGLRLTGSETPHTGIELPQAFVYHMFHRLDGLSVHIPDLIVPGAWLDLSDRELATAAESQLRSLESALDEAAVALDLFEQALAHSHPRLSAATWSREIQRQGAIRAKYESDERTVAAGSSAEARFQAEMEARFHAEVAAKREDWAAGNLPKEYRHLLPFMYAKVFVYAIDSMRKALRELRRLAGLPATVVAQVDAFEAAFPTLRQVRDSTAHEEQRRLGLDRNRQPLQLKEPVLVIGSLRGSAAPPRLGTFRKSR